MKSLKEVLAQLSQHEITVSQAEQLIKLDYLDKIDGAVQVDLLRHMRTGIPEAIFAETKSTEMVMEITARMLKTNQFAMLTRLKPEDFAALDDKYANNAQISYKPNKEGRVAWITTDAYAPQKKQGTVGVLTAGTSDIPVAEEAAMVLEAMGAKVLRTYDVGIAGFHRIFTPLKQMIKENADIILVIAGMEGTLPGVISALVDIPVIGVPTSTGYGLGAKGTGALTTMLQSCSPGLSVVNIDNGFGAATMAALIIRRIYSSKTGEQ